MTEPENNRIMTIAEIKAIQARGGRHGKWPWNDWLKDLQPDEGREITQELKEAGLKPQSFAGNTRTAKKHGLIIMRAKHRVWVVRTDKQEANHARNSE